MAGPLDGVRVVEMAHMISGPYTGMLLSDLGAEVVKVELPGRGDIFRVWDGTEGGISPQFAAYNRGKRSVTLDVRSAAGREAYLRLARWADVVFDNFRPGVLDQMGAGYDAVSSANPRVIYCSINGMGSTGPYKSQPTYNTITQAISGLTSQLTDMASPASTGPTFSDQITSLFAALAIVAALHHRQQTGVGQQIEVSMLEAALAFQASTVADYLMEGIVADELTTPRRSQSYAFVASDGLPFAVHMSTPQRFWQGVADVIGHPELTEDPRFKTKPDRMRNYEILRDELAQHFRTRPRDTWVELLRAKDVPVAPINTIGEALDDPQVRHLDLLRTFSDGGREQKLVGYPFRLEKTPCTPGLPCPTLGEHTREVLAEIGFPADVIDAISGAE